MKFNSRILFTGFLVLLFAFVVFKAKSFAFAGRLFPLVVGIPALILSLIQLVLDLRANITGYEAGSGDFADIAPDLSIPPELVRSRGIRYLCWYLSLYLGIWIIGFKLAMLLFVIGFLRFEGRARWFVTGTLTALSGYLLFYHFENLLNLSWPDCVLSRWLAIPWLF